MIRISYEATALQQIHTGGDENFGTFSALRREKRRLRNPIKIETEFYGDDARREQILNIITPIYNSIDSSLKRKQYGFYEAFASKLLAATHVKTRFEFLTNLCTSCGVRIVNRYESVLEGIGKFSDEELLHTIRSEHQYLMLMLKNRIQNDVSNVAPSFPDLPRRVFEKNYEWIPYISGNSIRGILRRIVMADFLERIGIDRDVRGVDKDMYHQLMTGGNISQSTAYEDIGTRERYVHLCPMVGLFGSAIGNMTIQGTMKVGALRPMCREHGNDSGSFWETIDRDYGTRLDSSKTERDLLVILADQDKDSRKADQMKYEYEVFITGTKFDSDIIITDDRPIIVSAFWHMISLWKKNPFVGGMSAKGLGMIDIHIDVPEGATDLYLSHIEKMKGEALDFFSVERAVPVS